MSTSTEERIRGGIATNQVEYQMRFRDIITRASARAETEFEARTPGPFLTVSRDAGSGGAEVAQRVGERLGWAVLDKGLVNRLAGDLELEPRALEVLDETRANWFSETLLNLFNSRLVAQQEYVERVGNVCALVASSDPVVIVGRGAHLILPRQLGFCVRVIASRPSRVTTLSEAEGLDQSTAEKRIDEIDADRRGFIRRNFRKDLDDAALYDLIINTDTFGVEGSADVILRSMEVRGLV